MSESDETPFEPSVRVEGIDYDERPDPFARHRRDPAFRRIVEDGAPRDEDDPPDPASELPPYAEEVAWIHVTDEVHYADSDTLYAYPEGGEVVYAWASTFEGSFEVVHRAARPLSLGEMIGLLETRCPVDWMDLLTSDPDALPGSPERAVDVGAAYEGFQAHLERVCAADG